MTTGLVSAIERIYDAAVAAVDPRRVVAEHLHLDGETLNIAGTTIDVPGEGVYLIAIGKAAPAMIAAAEETLGEEFRAGIAVAKSIPEGLDVRTSLLTGSHPVPDERSLAAGREVAAFAEAVPDGAIALCLVSGGGSALVELLRPGVSLEDLQFVTSQLLNAGADIYELNAVRSRLSALKAGGLLATLEGKRVFNLILSDVLGDDPTVIASGPTVPYRESINPDEVLTRYGVGFTLPDPEPRADVEVETAIVGNISRALDAAAHEASRLGFRPVVLSASWQGEARVVGEVVGAMLADSVEGKTSFGPNDCLLAGAETTVTVTGDGVGGRNTEAALAAALRIEGTQGIAAGFLATDGDDANTGVAGGIVTGATIRGATRNSARTALGRNDSYTFLAGEGAAWGRGPTGTNVNDLIIGLFGNQRAEGS